MAVGLAAAGIGALGTALGGALSSSPPGGGQYGDRVVVPSVRVEAPVFGVRVDSDSGTIPSNVPDVIQAASEITSPTLSGFPNSGINTSMILYGALGLGALIIVSKVFKKKGGK